MRHLGRSLPRLEDRVHVTGRGRFAGDVAFPDQLHMRVVRSHVAYGRLDGVDVSAALAVPGVVAVWTAKDVARLPPVGLRVGACEALEPHLAPILAHASVRYVGEPVAAVFAESAGAADDAAELVALDVDLLEPVLLGGPLKPQPVEALTVRKSFGHLHAAFDGADRIVKTTLSLARDGGLPLETRATAARWDAGRDVLEVWGAAKSAAFARDALARMLARPRSGVAWHPVQVGGGFGTRGELSAEDVLVAHAAVVLGRPVRWVEDRREHLAAAAQARGMEAAVRAAVGADGTLHAIDAAFRIDQGAYLRPEGTMVADLVAALLPGPYRLSACRVSGQILLTNRTPAGTLRGAGRAEATFVRERLMDAIAAETGIAPLELRRRNLAAHEDMPFHRQVTALGREVVFDAARFQGLVDQAVRRFSLDVLRRRTEERRAAGELVGLGTAIHLDASAPGMGEHVVVSVDPMGFVEVATGATDLGQGIATALAQIVADILGVDYEAVRVTTGDTQRIEKSHVPSLFSTRSASRRATGRGSAARRRRSGPLRDLPPRP